MCVFNIICCVNFVNKLFCGEDQTKPQCNNKITTEWSETQVVYAVYEIKTVVYLPKCDMVYKILQLYAFIN